MKTLCVELVAHDTVVGSSVLQDGDRSSGSPFGDFVAEAGYIRERHATIIDGEPNLSPGRINLCARDHFGHSIDAIGIELLDFATELGERQVHVVGIPWEAYERYFGPST